MPLLPPDQLYPAGDPGARARFLRLRSGLRVRVVEAGAPSDEPVVMLSGWGSSAYAYRHTVPALAAAGFHPIVVELKGQGLSDKPLDPREYTLDALVAHAREVLDALALARLALVGHSLGGAIAIRVALAESDHGATGRIAKLALLSPVGFGTVTLTRISRRLPAALGHILPHASRRWMWRVGVGLAYAPSATPSERDIDEYWSVSSDPSYVLSLLSLLREVDWSPVDPRMLRALTMPLLVVFGTADRIVSPRRLDRMLDVVPHARVVLLPGVGHAVQEVAPGAVNRALIEFLRA